MGRHPAAVGLLPARPAPARLPAGPPVRPRRDRRAGGLPRPRADAPTGSVRRLEACQSPVWDTALALTALLDAGVPGRRPGRRARRDWLLGEEIRVAGDWSVRRPDLAPGGWAFEFANDGYPDTDDTAEVVLALRRSRHGRPGERCARRSTAACAWVVGMQSRDGGWGAFDADNTRTLADRAAVLRLRRGHRPAVGRRHRARRRDAGRGRAARRTRPAGAACAWLLDAQEPDGSWFGRWGANYVYGTGAVVPALVAAGVGSTRPARSGAARRAGSSDTRTTTAAGARTCAPTATRPGPGPGSPRRRRPPGRCWRCSPRASARPRSTRACAWLVDTQRADGNWDEPQFTGTGFPGDFYINYHLYRHRLPGRPRSAGTVGAAT